MENVYFGIAVASFILAVGCAIACVVVFVKLDVAEAIRFLRHRATASGVGLVGVLARKPKQRKANAEDFDRDTAPNIARKKGKHERSTGSKGGGRREAPAEGLSPDSPTDALQSDDSPTGCLDGPDGATGSLSQGEEPSKEKKADLAGADGSENPTDLLVDSESENPTDLLAGNDSENPTDLLCVEDSESPTEMLAPQEKEEPEGVEEQASLEPESENPTELLVPQEESAGQTVCLETPEDDSAPSKAEESVFRFAIKQSQVVVNTDEVIE